MHRPVQPYARPVAAVAVRPGIVAGVRDAAAGVAFVAGLLALLVVVGA